MDGSIRCPRCGGLFRPESVGKRFQGMCPRCLLGEAIELSPGTADRPTRKDPAPPPLKTGALFRGLEVLELLGHGGMGFVYKARQADLDRTVALKILSPRLAADPEFAHRFNREARAMARLDHPNIVRVIEYGKEGDLYFLTMDFVDGVPLRTLLRERRLSPAEALRIVPQICEALEYAHSEGVVHRDIKPENILLDRKGRVKIADFGLAKIQEGADRLHVTQTDVVMGTPHYMAPEQVENLKRVDHRADIYSLGVVFYEMLTGELPLGRFAPPSKKIEVDVRLDEIVLRALEKEPERRYQRAVHVKTELETYRSSPGPVRPRTSKRAVAGLILCLPVGFFGVGYSVLAQARWPYGDTALSLAGLTILWSAIATAFAVSALILIRRNPYRWKGGVPAMMTFVFCAAILGFDVWVTLDRQERLSPVADKKSPPPSRYRTEGWEIEALVGSEILTIDSNGRVVGRRKDDGRSLRRHPGLSPDGKTIAYASRESGEWQIWLKDADGKNPRRITNHAGGARDPRFSPKGDRLAYLLVGKGEPKGLLFDLAIMKPDGTDQATLVMGKRVHDFSWDPTGRYLAYSMTGELVIYDVVGRTPHKRFSFRKIHPDLYFHGADVLTWRPDGGTLACRILFVGQRTKGGAIRGDRDLFLIPLKRREEDVKIVDVGGRPSKIGWRGRGEKVHLVPLFSQDLLVTFDLKGHRLVVVNEDLQGRPRQAFERLYLVKDGKRTRVEKPRDLQGKVRIRTRFDALEFVRLLTSRETHYLWKAAGDFPKGLEVGRFPTSPLRVSAELWEKWELKEPRYEWLREIKGAEVFKIFEKKVSLDGFMVIRHLLLYKDGPGKHALVKTMEYVGPDGSYLYIPLFVVAEGAKIKDLKLPYYK